MCAGADDEPVLLLPPEYQLLEPARNLPRVAQLLHLAKLQNSRVQALTFGIKGKEKVSSRAGHPAMGGRTHGKAMRLSAAAYLMWHLISKSCQLSCALMTLLFENSDAPATAQLMWLALMLIQTADKLVNGKTVMQLCPETHANAAPDMTGHAQVSMPTSPTWIAYKGDHQECIDAVPVAVQRGTFCRAFLGHVRPPS